MRMRVQGVVILEALIDDTGTIANARVMRSVPLLDSAALEAVSQWVFTPDEPERPRGPRHHDRHRELHAAVTARELGSIQ